MNECTLNIQEYVYEFLKEMNDLYSFEGKSVLFMFYDPSVENAKAVIQFGASKVYFVNPDLTSESDNFDNIIFLSGIDKKFTEISDKSVDLVIGLEILEHINNLDLFFSELKRILKPDGDIDLQGSPMWTSHYGHHLWIENKYIFYEDSNPFKPWEHLCFENEDEMENSLIQKELPKADCKEITDWIYNPIEISRHTPSEIIEAATGLKADSSDFKTVTLKNCDYDSCQNGLFSYSIKRTYNKIEPNEFFAKASKKYCERDLNTEKLSLKIRYTNCASLLLSDLKDNIFDGLEDWEFNLIKTFVAKHSVKNKRILNLSMYNSIPVSKMFLALGAKEVISYSPCVFADKNDNTDNFVHYSAHFEDADYTPEKCDIVFGLDVLTDIINADKFFAKLKNIVDYDTVFYLTGFMPYTFACGHKIYTDNHKFLDETNPLQFWQHLSINTKEELSEALKQVSVSAEEMDCIVHDYLGETSSVKICPSEIAEKFAEFTNVYLRRIYQYYPKNDFYYEAAKKYSEDDLNTWKIIITSDIPGYNQYDELDIPYYIKDSLSDINAKYKIKDKRILNITPYVNAKASMCIEAFQAKEVVSLDFYDSGMELEGGRNIKCVRQLFDDLNNITGTFDIIYGLDVLEHVNDLENLFNNLKRLVADNGLISLQGSPLWSSAGGHACSLNLECGMLKTGEEGLCLAPWEHLAYDNQEELKNAMIKKGFSENDAEKVSDFIFNSKEINRKSYADILEILDNIDGITYGMKKILQYPNENEFYSKASEKYTHEELRTKELKLNIRKKLRTTYSVS